MASVIATVRLLDLHDIGAEIREDCRGIGSGQNLTDFDNTHVLKHSGPV